MLNDHISTVMSAAWTLFAWTVVGKSLGTIANGALMTGRRLHPKGPGQPRSRVIRIHEKALLLRRLTGLIR